MTRQQAAPRHTNRLISETSPYLLQHADNPVDWHPWGEEALRRAREENRPILLSIGYSACHWCHVMERESFEDENIAALMNQHFVCIKVDREEREAGVREGRPRTSRAPSTLIKSVLTSVATRRGTL
jgi:uncharacterized protein YyaL (SSP411 family)